MDDGRHLLKAILGNRRDDTPRLIYADWLDENNQSDRAAFVRDCPLLKHRRVRYGRWEWTFDKHGKNDPAWCGLPQQFRVEAAKVVPVRMREHWDAYTIRHGFVDAVTIHPDVITDTPGVWGRTLNDYPVTRVLFTRRGWVTLKRCRIEWPGIKFAYVPGAR